MSAPLLLLIRFLTPGRFRKDRFSSVVVYHVTQQQTRLISHEFSIHVKSLSRRGEGGCVDEWWAFMVTRRLPKRHGCFSHVQHINQPERNQQEKAQTDHCDCRVNQWSAHQAATHPYSLKKRWQHQPADSG